MPRYPRNRSWRLPLRERRPAAPYGHGSISVPPSVAPMLGQMRKQLLAGVSGVGGSVKALSEQIEQTPKPRFCGRSTAPYRRATARRLRRCQSARRRVLCGQLRAWPRVH
jgi:hypothetical protein